MRICSIHIRDMYRFVSPYMIRYLKECQYYSSSFSAVGSVSLSPISLSCSRTSPCSSSVMGGGTDRLLPLQSHPLSSSVTYNQSIHECAMSTVKKLIKRPCNPQFSSTKHMLSIGPTGPDEKLNKTDPPAFSVFLFSFCYLFVRLVLDYFFL